MTREEAINILYGIQADNLNLDNAYIKNKYEALDMAIKAIEQELITKNNSKFCPDRKAKTTHMKIFLHCVKDECVAYKDGKCLKYNSDQESTTNNDLGVKEFEGIDVTYSPEEVCIYSEYKGKPYFTIKYKENGKEIIGYGTYNSEVLSQYLKEYFISTTKNDLEEVYNKGYEDGVKSVNICPYCGEYIGVEDENDI